MRAGRQLSPPRMVRRTLAAVGIGLLLPAAGQGVQVPFPAGRPVTAVRLVVDGQPTEEPGLVRLVEVATGRELSPVEVRDSIVLLMALGRFEDVQARAEETAGGIVVTFEARSARKITGLLFRGDLGVSAGTLRAAVVERYTASPPRSKAAEIARTLEALCRDHGYVNARVVERVEPAPQPDRATLAFEVTAGLQVRAGQLTVTGQPGMPTEQLLGRLGLKAGQPFDPTVVRRKASELADGLRTERYFEARVTPQVAYSPSGEVADVTIAVSRGPLVTLTFVGDRLPAAREAELVPIQREGSVDEDLLEDAQRNIENFYRAQGYRDAKASYSRESQGDSLTLAFTVQRGPQYRVEGLDFAGNSHVTGDALRAGLRVQPGILYVKSQLDADVASVVERYRRLGFSLVRVTPVEQAAPARRPGDHATIRVRLDIVEGPRTVIGAVRFDGGPQVRISELEGLVQSVSGRPFSASQLGRDREAVLVTYLNRGYQTATVETALTFSDDRQLVDVTFVLREGPQILVDHVLIVGNTRTSARTIEEELVVKPGQPLVSAELVISQQRLIALGLFRGVSVTELQRGFETTRDVLVAVEEAPATTFSYGGGVEGSRRLLREGPDDGQTVERFEFAPRGFVDIGWRNLWGKNRTINFFARLSVRSKDPTASATAPGSTWASSGGLGFSEYRVQANYREPRVAGATSDLIVTGLAERGYRSSFNFDRQLLRAEVVHRFTAPLSLSGSFVLENTRLFNERFNREEQLLIDRAFPQVRLSIINATLARDTRDDPVDPSSGTLTSLDGQLALRVLGSEVGFAKAFTQGFIYRLVPGTKRIVFAGGARVGLARGGATTIPVLDEKGQPIIGPDGQPLTTVTTTIPASERFYAGGDTTVRAFTRDRLGTEVTIDRDGFPRGGMAMVIFNAELRVPVWRWIGAVAFVDVGNVFFRAGDISPRELRPALGGGLRFRLPVLPVIRIDAGYNPSPRVFQNGGREKSWSVYVGIGQAF